MEYIEVVLKAICIGIFLGLFAYSVALAISIEKKHKRDETQRNNQEINIPGGVEDE